MEAVERSGGEPVGGLAAGARAGREPLPDAPSRKIQALWFALARRNWTSLVLVPADRGGSAASIATALADVGRRLSETPVTFFIMADPVNYASAGNMLSASGSTGPGSELLVVAPAGRVIVAIQPVVVEPLGLAVTQATQTVVLCIEAGRTRLAAARRTVELIGRERVAGCLFLT